jgi:hypothetical protein
MSEEAYFCAQCGSKLKNKTSDKIYMPTPHGGVMSEASYFDREHNPCTKDKACFMEIAEYDEEGTRVYKFTARKKSVQP